MKKKKVIKKKLEDFIKDETGFITKDNILKFGLGTITALGIMSSLTTNVLATAHSNHAQHNNTIGGTPATATCVKITHASHCSHGNHSSY